MSRFTRTTEPIDGFKMMNAEMRQQGYLYQIGLNFDTNPLDERNPKSGLHLVRDANHLSKWFKYGDRIAYVTVPAGALVEVMRNQIRADRLIVHSVVTINDFFITQHDPEAFIGGQYSILKFIDEPEEELCIKAVRADYNNIQYIRNPSEEVRKIVIAKNPEIIKQMETPSDASCKLAIEIDIGAFYNIENPSEVVCKRAIEIDPETIKHVKNPSEYLCRLAVSRRAQMIKYIENPSDEVCILAIKQDDRTLKYIKNPSNAVCRRAIELYEAAIGYIQNQTDDLCKLHIDLYGRTDAIRNMTPELISYLLKKNPLAVTQLKSPTFEMFINAYAVDPNIWRYMDGTLTDEMAKIVVKDDPTVIYGRSDDFKKAACLADPKLLDMIPYGLHSEELYLAVVANNANGINYMRRPSEAVLAAHAAKWGSA